MGGPLIKDKLFGYASYEHTHVSDLEIGTSRTAVPFGLTDEREPDSASGGGQHEFQVREWYFLGSSAIRNRCSRQSIRLPSRLLNYKLPNGQYMIPSANPTFISDA